LGKIGGAVIELPLFLDWVRLVFLFTVRVITLAVLTFSQDYMSQEKHFIRFHFLVITFVGSIYLLILRPNVVRILLGWDGLGVTSYLLVVYFNSSKSFNAGLLTALTNRVGDCLILLAIACLITSNS
jgi:NADH-ubiquinone oxidoreductase chain 5